MSYSIRPLYVLIAIATDVRAKSNHVGGAADWIERWEDRLNYIEKNLLPSGSGFDRGSKIDLDASSRDKIVIKTSFHHMNENGYYDGWTDHTVTVKPDLVHGFTISVSGVNKNEIKNYIADAFNNALTEKTDWVLIDFPIWESLEA